MESHSSRRTERAKEGHFRAIFNVKSRDPSSDLSRFPLTKCHFYLAGEFRHFSIRPSPLLPTSISSPFHRIEAHHPPKTMVDSSSTTLDGFSSPHARSIVRGREFDAETSASAWRRRDADGDGRHWIVVTHSYYCRGAYSLTILHPFVWQHGSLMISTTTISDLMLDANANY